MRSTRRRPRRHVFLSALNKMKQTKQNFPQFTSFLRHFNTLKLTIIMSLAHLENARSMHLENESLEMLLSREFSRKGVDFSHKKRLAQSHRVRGMLDRMRTNARKLVSLFFSRSCALSHFFFLFFATKPRCCVVLRVVVVRYMFHKGENNARIRFTLKTTDPFSYEQTCTKNNRKRTIKTSTEAEKRKSNALAALGRNRSKRFTEQ